MRIGRGFSGENMSEGSEFFTVLVIYQKLLSIYFHLVKYIVEHRLARHIVLLRRHLSMPAYSTTKAFVATNFAMS